MFTYQKIELEVKFLLKIYSNFLHFDLLIMTSFLTLPHFSLELTKEISHRYCKTIFKEFIYRKSCPYNE